MVVVVGVVVADVVGLDVAVVVADVVGVVPSQLTKEPSARKDSVKSFMVAAAASHSEPSKKYRPNMHSNAPGSAAGPRNSPIA